MGRIADPVPAGDERSAQNVKTGLGWPLRLLCAAHPPFRHETIAHPWLGLDVLPAGLTLQFFPELPDEDAQVLRLMGRLPTPYGCQQSPMRHDFSRIASQVDKKVKLLGRQVDGLALDGDGVGRCIHHKITYLDGRS